MAGVMKAENIKIPVRPLGRTGFEVSALGLGGHTYPVGDRPDDFITPDDRARLLQYLVSSGVNYLDTTFIHEVELLADSLRRANIDKGSVCISLQYAGGISDSQWRYKLRGEVESRLAILGDSFAPLFLMGIMGEKASHAEVVSACEAMQRLKEENLIRNIGLSCHTVSLYPVIAGAIRETGLIDYIMVLFNWKFQQANEELFPVARDHGVGIVGMKIFCWDGVLGRRISVFEPVNRNSPVQDDLGMTPAQRHLLWCLQNSPCDVVVPSMNTSREAKENVRAFDSISARVETGDFEAFACRLGERREIRKLALHASVCCIRKAAGDILSCMRSIYWECIAKY
jgi:aryl-alcohol dehydrogenase-like predicted oxidoreductase